MNSIPTLTKTEFKNGIRYTTHYIDRPIEQGDPHGGSIGVSINGVNTTTEIINYEYNYNLDKSEYMKPYLIQRAFFDSNPNKQGIDSILRFDYMGSSEFEWGALPQSLGRIRENINSYEMIVFQFHNKVISVFCAKSKIEEVTQYLTHLCSDTVRTLEFVGFKEYIEDSGFYKDTYDFWWDLRHDLMFWKHNPDFEEKFRVAISTKPKFL